MKALSIDRAEPGAGVGRDRAELVPSAGRTGHGQGQAGLMGRIPCPYLFIFIILFPFFFFLYKKDYRSSPICPLCPVK